MTKYQPKGKPSGRPSDEMDSLDQLPDQILLHIFQFLEFEQIVRITRVCSRFRDFCELLISNTIDLNLTQTRFKNLRSPGFAVLLHLCSARLERLEFPRTFDRSLFQELGQIDGDLSRLSILKIQHTRLGEELFEAVLKRCPNLKTLIWNHSGPSPRFPEILIPEKLETLRISNFDDQTFRSLAAGKCPNLKELETEFVEDVSRDVLEHFFDEYRGLGTLIFREFHGSFDFRDMQYFWRLNSLTTLIIFGDPAHRFTDIELNKISTSFPLLEELGLVWLRVTKEGVSELGKLSNVKRLWLENACNAGDGELDEGIMRAVELGSGSLEKFQFGYSISAATLRTLVTRCEQLQFVCTWKIKEVTTEESAVDLVYSMAGGVRPGMNVTIRICHEASTSIFSRSSGPVSTALQDLGEQTGATIRFEEGESIKFWDSTL